MPGLEVFSRVVPLGINFRDVVSGELVDGLSVTGYVATMPGRRVTAVPNRSRAYVFHDIPGLRNFGFGNGEGPFWAANPPHTRFTVEVEDSRRQFQPFRFTVRVPVRGLLSWRCAAVASPPDPLS